jgi:hypothetical protein
MATPELNKALAALQAEMPKITTNKTARVRSEKAKYDHDYADLDAITYAIMPLLGKHGLAFTAFPTLNDDGHFVFAYTLLHESGEERHGQYPLPTTGTPQSIGSAITYARRYCLSAVTGIAAGGDDDGDAARDTSMDRPRIKTAHTDPEYVRVREAAVGRSAQERPAQRTKGPIPDGDNVWQGPLPDTAKGAVPTRAGVIVRHFERLGITDRGVRLGYTHALTGHAVASTSELSDDEQKLLLEVLSKCKNQAALDSLSKQEVST